MSCHQISVRGVVLDSVQHEPIQGLRVELWAHRASNREREFLGSATTGEGGQFGITYADRLADSSFTQLRLILREANGKAVQGVEGPTLWPMASPPARIVLIASVKQALERSCPRVPTLRRAYHDAVAYPVDTSETLNVGSEVYAGEVGRIVGTVRGADGRGLPNLRLRLTARLLSATVEAPDQGGYSGTVREIELARTYTNGDAIAGDVGTYEIRWPLELPETQLWSGQGWLTANNPPLRWSVPALQPPYLLVLRVEAPLSGDSVDLELPPGWSQPYQEIDSTLSMVREPGEPALLLQDFQINTLSLPGHTAFSRLSQALSPFEHAFFHGVGTANAGTVNEHFDAMDLAVLAEGHGLNTEEVAAWMLSHKLAFELAGAANRSKNVLVASTPLATHLEILSAELCYGIIRSSGLGATSAVLDLPLSEVRQLICLAVHRHDIAARTPAQLDEILDLVLHAGVGAQKLNPDSTTITQADYRENSLLAVLSASEPDPASPPTGTTDGDEARLLALHRAAILIEQLRRSELSGQPLPESELWSTDPSAPAFDNGEPLNNSVWNLVRKNQDFFGEPLDSLGEFGDELTFFERLADNSRLGRLMFQVSVAVERFWISATAVHELAEMTAGEIESLATDEPPATLPAPFFADGTPDPGSWAEQVMRRAHRSYWSRGLRGALSETSSVLATFEAGLPPDANLRRMRLRPSDMPGATPSEKRAALREALAVLRRAKLADHGEEAETISALSAAGITSGSQIARMGRKRFLSALGGDPEHREIHARATLAASAGLTLWADRHPNAQGVGIDPSSPLHFSPVVGDDDWALHPISFDGAAHSSGLIGYADYEHWQTIFSPLAYLAELLSWIDQRGGLDGTGNLAERRPDIEHIHLSKATTFGVVPYLTIALEVLEVAAARRFDGSFDPFDAPLKTILRSEEGSDTASYLFARAYEGEPSLADSPWPVGVPFSLATSRIEAYLELAGQSRWGFMHELRAEGGGAAAEAALDGATLSLPQAVVEAFGEPIDDTSTAVKAWAGLGASDSGLGDMVAEFMLHFGLSLPEVRAVVRHRGLHPPGAPQRPLSHTTEAWTFDDLVFANSWPLEDCQRVARFLRLSRATGWTLYETDLAARPCWVDAATPVDLTHADLSKIAGLRAVERHTGLPLARLHAWWADLDTFGPGDGASSPYEQRFLRNLPAELTPSSSIEPSTPPHGLQLTSDRTEVVGLAEGETFEDLRDAIRGALAVDNATLERLVAHVNGLESSPEAQPMDLVVSLSRLSMVSRWVDLAAWLDLPAPRLLDLSALLQSGDDPFTSPWFTYELLVRLSRAAELGFSAATLADLLAPGGLDTLPSATRQARIRALAELRHDLREVKRDLLRMDSRTEAETWDGHVRLVLAELLTAPDVERAIEGLEVATYVGPEDLLEKIGAALEGTGFDAMQVKDLVAAAGEEPEDRSEVLIEAVRAALYLRRSRALVADALRQEFGDGDDLALWAGRLEDSSEASLHERLLAEAFVGEVSISDPAPVSAEEDWSPEPAELEDLLQAWRGAERVVTFARRCGLSNETLEWLSGRDVSQGFARPEEILEPHEAAPDLLQRVLTTVAWVQIGHSLPGSGPSLPVIHATPSEELYGAALGERLGWSSFDISQLASEIGVVLDANGRLSASVLVRLGHAARQLQRLGALPDVVASWSAPSPTLEASDAVVSAVRQVVGAQRWAQASRPIEGRLWRARRNALIAALSMDDTGRVHTADELYEHLLIDPLVEPCGKTSRAREAIAATQHFIQRWMLGLEPQAPALTEDDRADWRWMKTYRVWEAARRVFLYPENWLRPELRKETSEAFERLTSSLGSAELTEEEVERAYLSYLQEVHEIGSIEVVAHYDEQLGGGTTSGADLHVVGRTRSNPPRYFYRARVEGRWQPWESLDLGIEGVHVMIVRHLGRLMVLWPSFVPKPETRGEGENAWQYPRTEVTWHWAIRRSDGWSKPEASRDPVLIAEGHEFEDRDYRTLQFRLYRTERDGLPELQVWHLGAASHMARIRVLTLMLDSHTQMALALGGLGYIWADEISRLRREIDRLSNQPRDIGPTTGWRWDSIADGLVHGGVELDEDSVQWALIGTTANLGQRDGIRKHNSTSIRTGSVRRKDRTLNMARSSTKELTGLAITLHEPPQVWNFAYSSPYFVSSGSRSYLVSPAQRASTSVPVVPSGSPLLAEVHDLGVFDVPSGLSTQGLPPIPSDVHVPTATVSPQAYSAGDSLFQGATEALFAGQQPSSSPPAPASAPRGAFDAELFYHPHMGWLIERIRTFGLLRCLSGGESEPALDGLHQQSLDESLTAPGLGGKTRFEHHLAPVPGAFDAFPTERFAFERSHPLAPYNWEIFFHAPMLIADRYRQAGDFESALRWYQTIFDPTAGTPERMWRFGPFALEAGASEAEHFRALVDAPDADPQAIGDLRSAMAYWMRDPFDAHRAASVRSGAYRRWVVRETIETLIAWGDDLFTRYTSETVAEARQLYVLAGGLLGRRPVPLPPPAPPEDAVVGDLLDEGELGGDLAYEMAECWVSTSPPAMGLVDGLPSALPGTSDFFGIPFNEHLLRLWDTVADRNVSST